MMRVFCFLSLLMAACSVDVDPTCRGRIIECNQPAYFPLCADPGENDATRAANGLYCVNNAGDDFGRSYIGPLLEHSDGCSLEDEPLPCASGQETRCVFLPNCTDDDIAATKGLPITEQ